ncbi:Atxe2 family lasso peptide isopeptidase [Sphingobium yanoikuyae]|uniref:Atxe2 family lasso peptide isopeptidase n=1 Tax=Sphingobium yanoikuyae TaxID=13690 RepID=UPI00345E9128
MSGGRTMRAGAYLLLGASLLAFCPEARAEASCADLLPGRVAAEPASRLINADDLVRLRDIGRPEGSAFSAPTPLGASPDGQEVAFILRRADPGSNSYCLGLVVVSRDGAVRLLDQGGELATASLDGEGGRMPTGVPEVWAPRWSPDGGQIAFLRRDSGITQLWIVSANGGKARAITHGKVDIEAFAWSVDGRSLLVASRPAILADRARVDAEGLGGWLYDRRVAPNIGPRPRPPVGLAIETRLIDIATGAERAATQAEAEQLAESRKLAPFAQGNDGQRAWLAPESAAPLSAERIHVRDRDGRDIPCRSPLCLGDVQGLWWDVQGHLYFLRREGWAKEDMVLYAWTLDDSAPQPVLRTRDVLLGCVQGGGALYCLRENATTPRYLARIALTDGSAESLFVPNPEFAHIRLGSVERLRWRNDRGLAAWGDLVLPPDARPGQQFPLVVVQYHSDGFLRGGTGDEYPIQLFAAHGMAVLSLERPAFVATGQPGLRTMEDFNRAMQAGWAERWSLLSSLMAGIDAVKTRGIVDPDRIGITGLSDGSSTVRFALINRPIFAAASISNCCFDANMVMMQAGIAYADKQRAYGLPPLTRPDPDLWRPYSVAMNAGKLDRPLLMQLSDDEYIHSLEGFTALREYGQPVEMHIFPGEHHIKWQPAHRRAAYLRNLDWFAYWLQGARDPDPAKQDQYARWDAMRSHKVAPRNAP